MALFRTRGRWQARGHPLAVVTESHFEGQSRSRLPAVLQPETDGERAEARRRVSERLEENVGPSGQKIRHRREQVDAGKAVRHAGVETNLVQVEADIELAASGGIVEA